VNVPRCARVPTAVAPVQSADPIDLSRLKPTQLNNVGLLTATLHSSAPADGGAASEGTEVGAVQLVVQVAPAASRSGPAAADSVEALHRVILNPWEE